MFRANDNDKEVTCNSIYLASALYAQGIRLESVLCGNGRSNEFVFANEDGAADMAVKSYFDRSTKLPPKDVFEALAQLKKEADTARWRTPKP